MSLRDDSMFCILKEAYQHFVSISIWLRGKVTKKLSETLVRLFLQFVCDYKEKRVSQVTRTGLASGLHEN